jgi:hypothetical protein
LVIAMKNLVLAAMLSASVAVLPMQAAQAGLFKKIFVVGSVLVGGVALSKAAATKHCASNPADPQCVKHVKGTDADPALAGAAQTSPTPVGAPVGAAAQGPKVTKDPNAMIDAGAAKAKDLTAKAGSWIARKKAEHEAKKAARAAASAGVAPAAAGAPVAAAPALTPAK